MLISDRERRRLAEQLTDTLEPYFPVRVSAGRFARKIVKELCDEPRKLGQVSAFVDIESGKETP